VFFLGLFELLLLSSSCFLSFFGQIFIWLHHRNHFAKNALLLMVHHSLLFYIQSLNLVSAQTHSQDGSSLDHFGVH
jgi:hypothetical protein